MRMAQASLLRRLSTASWRQAREADIYASRAAAEGLRSRAAFKLEELDSRFGRFLRRGAYVVDIGSAPGGFGCIAAKKLNLDTRAKWEVPGTNELDVSTCSSSTLPPPMVMIPKRKWHGKLVCVDVNEMRPILGAHFIRGDIRDLSTSVRVAKALGNTRADVVLSDVAPSTTSDAKLSHIRSISLAESALSFATNTLRNGGIFIVKIFSGAEEDEFRDSLKKIFVNVKSARPKACKKHSVEKYYVASGFVHPHVMHGFATVLVRKESCRSRNLTLPNADDDVGKGDAAGRDNALNSGD